jgi:hypothetical protein
MDATSNPDVGVADWAWQNPAQAARRTKFITADIRFIRSVSVTTLLSFDVYYEMERPIVIRNLLRPPEVGLRCGKGIDLQRRYGQMKRVRIAAKEQFPSLLF